nr:MAG TPA: hypothetical protein [Caudoviricetes sp.]
MRLRCKDNKGGARRNRVKVLRSPFGNSRYRSASFGSQVQRQQRRRKTKPCKSVALTVRQ